MKKPFYYIILFLCTFPKVTNASGDFDHIRKVFHQAVFRSEAVPEYIGLIEAEKNNENPLFTAYLAASMALQARETWNPMSKISYVGKYRQLIKEAIENDMENLEIRFLRYAIEFNLPKLIRSESLMDEDKKQISSGIHEIDSFEVDESFILYIVQLFKDTDSWSQSEIELIESKIVGRNSTFSSEG